MKVYESGGFYGHERGERALAAVPVNYPFVWTDTEGIVQAIYPGKKRLVLDVAIRIPAEKAELFLTDWSQERRLSDLSAEELEQMERENPFALNFSLNVSADGKELQREGSTAMSWHPLEGERACIEHEAEELMEAYGCSRSCGWLFVRSVYRCVEKQMQNPGTLSLEFVPLRIPFSGGHFVTEEGCGERVLEIRHPLSNEAYELTIYGSEAEKLDGELPRNGGMIWPDRCQKLTYSITPEPEAFSLQDAANSDPPRKPENTGRTGGAASVFMAGKYPEASQKRIAYSAPHFEPVSRIEWRMVFHEKLREKMTLTIQL